MVNVSSEITINCPKEIVAEFASNPDYAKSWYKNIKEVKWQTVRSLSIGSRILFKAKFLGKQLEYIYEVIEYVPSKKLVMKTFDGPFPMETTYTWDKISADKTLMKLNNKGKPKGFSFLLAPLISRFMKKANMQDLKTLKKILEQY